MEMGRKRQRQIRFVMTPSTGRCMKAAENALTLSIASQKLSCIPSCSREDVSLLRRKRSCWNARRDMLCAERSCTLLSMRRRFSAVSRSCEKCRNTLVLPRNEVPRALDSNESRLPGSTCKDLSEFAVSLAAEKEKLRVSCCSSSSVRSHSRAKRSSSHPMHDACASGLWKLRCSRYRSWRPSIACRTAKSRRRSWSSQTCVSTPKLRASSPTSRRLTFTLRNPADAAPSSSGLSRFLTRTSSTPVSLAISCRQSARDPTVSNTRVCRHTSTNRDTSSP
mmetsp:Transcript_70740/g.147325  ORF Transcript_70740/g.147325 Transcript_70740/m.147325 type:complete len:279 (-) Transcript_70740:96-932(-)